MLSFLASCRSRIQKYDLSSPPPKREFRGAWIQTVYQDEYARLGSQKASELLKQRIEALHRAGCNAVIFQIRPESDAFYASSIEPWSRFLTGSQGQAPSPYWDPLALAIEQCHNLGMELHAWINPYRAATSASAPLAPNHPASQNPERVVNYNGQLYYDPALPENREHICRVVTDLVLRYDIDALHMDDYFYPYPVAGLRFPDQASFERYGRAEGYSPSQIGDWRRSNVNKLIAEIRQTVENNKPWVRFGISPFGIYRNKRSTPDGSGSNTFGLQNYDDLYADVLLWDREKWIDYLAPQLYWPFGYRVADFGELAPWWRRHLGKGSQLYFGIDVKKTMSERQLGRKIISSREHAHGIIYWPANEIVNNTAGVADSLRLHYHRSIAIIPADSKHKHRPKKVTELRLQTYRDGVRLSWKDASDPFDPVKPQFYVVYLIPRGQKVGIDHPEYIVYQGPKAEIFLPSTLKEGKYTCLVTALDRFKNESRPAKIKLNIR